ncbi:hypothetical protein Bbelb_035450 [Branchiostoma belcheri]|nr:hypothetical protein Bbelb_035450 [Branchiostoma belcheri]
MFPGSIPHREGRSRKPRQIGCHQLMSYVFEGRRFVNVYTRRHSSHDGDNHNTCSSNSTSDIYTRHDDNADVYTICHEIRTYRQPSNKAGLKLSTQRNRTLENHLFDYDPQH